jgi:hypothetical protein
MTFATKKDLTAWLEQNGYEQLKSRDWYLPGCYCLSHGEYSQPDYSVRRYKDGWSLRGNYYFYQGTIGVGDGGRVDDVFFETAEE